MELRLDLSTIIGFMGVLQGIILSLFLFRFDRTVMPQNRILAFLILVFSIVCFGGIAYYSLLIYRIPWFIRVHSPFTYLLVPLLYLYVKMMINYEFRLRKVDYLHFLPFFLSIILLFPVYLMSIPDKLSYLARQFKFNSPDLFIFYSTVLISAFAYFTLTIRALMKAYRSEKEIKTTRYLGIKKWLIIFTTFFVLVFATATSRIYFGINNDTTHWIPIVFALMIYFLSFEAIRKPFIFESNKDQKYLNSKLSIDELNEIIRKVSDYITKNQSFLKKNFSINELANKTSIQVNNLSRAINEITKQNYFDFMNNFRVNKAKKLLQDNGFQHYSIEGIGQECGFNSKASFYSAFKKMEVMTPNEFRRNNAVQDSNNELTS